MSNQERPLVRPMEEGDLDEADRVFRVAFGTFLGAPDPATFFGDVDVVRTRWRANPSGALVAEVDGRIVGSNIATNWGSLGFFGPLSVSPDLWDQGVARDLLEATMQLFESWSTTHVGLFTFAQSAKHVGLYQKFGFWPRFLTAVMSRTVVGSRAPGMRRMSEVHPEELPRTASDIRALTDAVFPGLDITIELDAVLTQHLGDIVLVDGDAGLDGAAVCHVGPGTEAGSGNCYIKFGAVRPGPGALERFKSLVNACDRAAGEAGASTLIAGANAEREHAWSALSSLGFRREMQGVAMHRPNDSGYSTKDAFVIDDWR